MTVPKQPRTWIEIALKDYPSGTVTTYKWGARTIAGTGRFVEGRISDWGEITRSLSDSEGSFEIAKAKFTVADDDGSIRTLIADMSSQHFENCEAAIRQLSDAGLAAGLTPRFYLRGIITDYQPRPKRMIDFELSDYLGSGMSQLNLDKKFGVKLSRTQHTNLPKENLNKLYPMYMGEHSDIGATDENGDPADKGMMPLIDCGDYPIVTSSGGTFTTAGSWGLGWRECGYNGVGSGSLPTGNIYTYMTAIDASGVETNDARGFLFYANPASPAFYTRFITDVTPAYWRLYVTDDPGFDPFTNPTAGSFVRFKDFTPADCPTGTNPYGGTIVPNERWILVDSLTWGADWKTASATKVSQPRSLTASVVGTTGSTHYTFGVTALSALGESLFSNIVTITNGPAVLTASNYIHLSWTAPATNASAVVGYRVWGRTVTSGNPPKWLDIAAGTTFDDIGTLQERNPPAGSGVINTAVGVAEVWGRFLVKLGDAPPLTRVYVSNMADKGTPKRVAADVSLFGVSAYILTPDDPNWPYPTRTLTFDGVEAFYILVRGPYAAAHRDGSVTMAVSGGGDADGSGNIIDQAFPALQHFMNEYFLKNSGTGYLSGSWGPLEAFSDGTTILKASAFAAAQALTVQRMGSRGYIAAWSVTEETTIRDFLRDFCQTFDCMLGIDHFGRLFPVLFDDLADPTVGRLYTDKINVSALEDPGKLGWDELETTINYSYDWDTDAQSYRFTGQLYEDTISVAAHHRVIQRSDRSYRCVRDLTTLKDVLGRRLARYRQVPRYVQFRTDLTGLEDDLGSQIRLTHYDGLGVNGDVATPMLVVRHSIQAADRPSKADSVVLTCFDLSRILSSVFGALQNESTMTGNLLDETSSSPTTAALELT